MSPFPDMTGRGRAGRAGDTVVVTGCSGAVGRETSLRLADRGFRVVGTAPDAASREAVQRAAAERGVELDVVALDPADRDSVLAAVQTVARRGGGVFGLVHAEAADLRGAAEDTSEAELRGVFETNALGTIRVTQAVLPHMRSAGCGRIVTITSVTGRVPGFGAPVSCSTRFAQEGFAEALAFEVAPFGIQSIIVAPGPVRAPRRAEPPPAARRAGEASSPYFAHLWVSEALVDAFVERSPTTAADVASVVEAALTDAEPRLRYVVGRAARMIVLLRRHLPERLFERLYYGGQLRRLERRIDPVLLPARREEVRA